MKTQLLALLLLAAGASASAHTATEKAFKTEAIKPRVTFTPGVELKTALRDNSYETVRKTEEAGKDKKKKKKEENGPVPDTV